MKKAMMIVIIMTVCAGAASAQQKFSISLDAAQLIKGIVWWDTEQENSMIVLVPAIEFRSHPRFTWGGVADIYIGKVEDTDFGYFGLTVRGRGYPFSTKQDKLFFDTGLGFNMFSYDGELDVEKGGFFGPVFSLGVGYRLMVGSKFFVEPGLSYVYAKTPGVAYIPTPAGWQAGLKVGLLF